MNCGKPNSILIKALYILLFNFLAYPLKAENQIFFDVKYLPIIIFDKSPVPEELKIELISTEVGVNGETIGNYKFIFQNHNKKFKIRYAEFPNLKSYNINTKNTNSDPFFYDHNVGYLQISFKGLYPIKTFNIIIDKETSSISIHEIIEKHFIDKNKDEGIVLISNPRLFNSNKGDLLFMAEIKIYQTSMLHSATFSNINKFAIIYPIQSGKIYMGCFYSCDYGIMFNIIFYESESDIEFTYSVFENKSKFHYSVSLERFFGYFPIYAYSPLDIESITLTFNLSVPGGFTISTKTNNVSNYQKDKNIILHIDNFSRASLKINRKRSLKYLYIDLSDQHLRNKHIILTDSIIASIKSSYDEYIFFASNNSNPIILDAITIPHNESSVFQFQMSLRSLSPDPPIVYNENQLILKTINNNQIPYSRIDFIIISNDFFDNRLYSFISQVAKSLISVDKIKIILFIEKSRKPLLFYNELLRYKEFDSFEFENVYF